MKLKTNNAANKPVATKKNKSPKKQAKGVEVRKEKSKDVVKPAVLKKEGEKMNVELSPQKLLQQELWSKAIINVSNMSNLSDVESSIVKLLADYKTKSSIPQKSLKLKNFITKGFSKFKDTDEKVLDGLYEKLSNEFKAVGGNVEKISAEKSKTVSKKLDSKKVKTNPKKKEASANEKMDLGGEDDDDDEEEDDIDDEDDDGGISFGDSDDNEESEEEKPKPKAKGAKANNKNGKNQSKNGSKFKGGKVQKKFGKKK